MGSQESAEGKQFRGSLSEIRQQAYRAVHQDGLVTLNIGLVLTWLVLARLAEINVAIIVLGIGALSALQEHARAHWTYPRVGYAKYPLLWPVIAASIASASLLLALFLLHRFLGATAEQLTWLLPYFLGAVVAAIMMREARIYFGLPGYLIAALAIISAPLVHISFRSPSTAIAVQGLTLAALLLAAGLVQFLSFLQRNRLPQNTTGYADDR